MAILDEENWPSGRYTVNEKIKPFQIDVLTRDDTGNHFGASLIENVEVYQKVIIIIIQDYTMM